MAFVGTLSHIKFLFGPLVIQLVWYLTIIHRSGGEQYLANHLRASQSAQAKIEYYSQLTCATLTFLAFQIFLLLVKNRLHCFQVNVIYVYLAKL